MASGIVIHVAAGDERRTEVLIGDRVRIGPASDCDLQLELPPSRLNSATILELTRSNGHYRVENFDPSLGLTLNKGPLAAGTPMHDGDIVRVPSSDLELQFFPITGSSALLSTRPRETYVAPFIEQAAIESAATARRDDAKVFLREFTRELIREINLSTKVIALTLMVALVGGVLYLGFATHKELQRIRRQADELNAQLPQIKQQASGINDQIKSINEQNLIMQGSLSLGSKLRAQYGDGVCLIAGTYIWVESGTGRPLRHPESRSGDDGAVIENGGDDTLQLTPEGRGSVAEFEVNGTGFHIGSGYILTNRHVVQPWTADERSMALSSSVNGRPRLTKLMAYFPNRNQPITLKLRKIAVQEEDLAVCSLDVKDLPGDIPVLPLDRDADEVTVGKNVVVMGYTSGPYRMLATLPPNESRSVQERYGASIESLLNYFAQRKMINPLTTQGHLTDLYPRRIVYDAATGEGGSGAPVFGPSGRVIGVNFAVFAESTASNFAIPIRFAIPLLEESGWSPPASPADKNQPGKIAEAKPSAPPK